MHVLKNAMSYKEVVIVSITSTKTYKVGISLVCERKFNDGYEMIFLLTCQPSSKFMDFVIECIVTGGRRYSADLLLEMPSQINFQWLACD